MTSAQPRPFGQLLKHHRIADGLTQEALAARAGLAARSVSDMERGLRRAPYHDSVSKLAEALQLSPAERAQFEAAARRPGTSSTRHSTGAPVGTPLTSPETPAGDMPSPVAAAPSAEWGIGIPAEMGNRRSSAGTLPPTPGPGGVPLTTLFRPIPGGAGRLIAAALAAARGRGTLVSRLVSVLLVAILFGGTLFSTGATAQHPRPGGGKLCLATDLPTSGDWAWAGKPVENAVNLAVQQNQSLGDHYALKVINYNDRGPHDPATGPQNVQQMVRNPCIVGIVGPYNSNVAMAEMPITAKAGLVMISPSTTNPALTLRPYAELQGLDFDHLHPPGRPISYFRIAPNDVAQGIVDADFSFEDLGARSAYVVNDRYPYGQELAGGFTQRFQVKGGRIVGAESIAPGNATLLTQVAARIVASGPDVVFYGGITETGGGLLKAQLVRAGYTGPLVGGDGIAQDPNFVAQAGATAANGAFATVAAPDPATLQTGAAATVLRSYHARYPGQELGGYGANAYDTAMLLITAIKHLIRTGQEVTRQAVLEQVQTIQYAGITGPISFDHNGDITHGVFSLYTVQDGKWVWVKQVSV